MCFLEIGKGPTPNVSCGNGQALEKAQNGNGWLLEKVGMDLGLAPRWLGVGATSAWVWRREGLAEPAHADIAKVARRPPWPSRPTSAAPSRRLRPRRARWYAPRLRPFHL